MRLKLLLFLILGALVAAFSGCVDTPTTDNKVDDLILDLKDDDVEVRENAALELGKIGDDRAVDPLIEALQDDNWGVRADAA